LPEDHEQRKECAKEFQMLWDRLGDGDKKFDEQGREIIEHGKQITGLQVNIDNLIKSMDAQTKSIWGMVVTVATIGIGFIIWFIQNQ